MSNLLSNGVTANEVLLGSLSPELREALMQSSQAIAPVLDDIHAHYPSSKDYAHEYERVLSYQPSKAKFLAIAMLHAGANPLGIAKAIESLSQRTAIHLK